MEYIYEFYCGNTARLSEAIRDRFPAFLGVVTSNMKKPKKLRTTIIRINFGIWDSDKPILDQIVTSHQPDGTTVEQMLPARPKEKSA
jgi:hypothetical protein